MKKLFLLFVFALGMTGYSQTEETDYRNEDFLIKTSGDTIWGKFKFTSSSDIKNKITCKVNDTLKLTIKAVDVKYFKAGGKEYIGFQPPNEEGHYLLRIQILGDYLELYEWQVPLDLSGGNKTEYIHYVRKKGDTEFIELYHSDWKKVLPDIIADYEELADAVWKGKYKIDGIPDIINKYNEWKEDNK